MTKQTLGQRIAESRRGRSMTQEALAEPEKRKPLSRLVLRMIDGGVAGQLMQVDTRDGAQMELWVDLASRCIPEQRAAASCMGAAADCLQCNSSVCVIRRRQTATEG